MGGLNYQFKEVLGFQNHRDLSFKEEAEIEKKVLERMRRPSCVRFLEDCMTRKGGVPVSENKSLLIQKRNFIIEDVIMKNVVHLMQREFGHL